MTYSTSFYHGYGVRVLLPEDWWATHDGSLEESIGFDGPVFGLEAGDYDEDWHWLFVRQPDLDTEIKLGTYAKVDPYRATDGQYPEWDWNLVDTAQKHGLKIEDGPSWFFVPDYS